MPSSYIKHVHFRTQRIHRHLDLFNQTNELAPEGVFDYVAGVVWNRKDGKPNDNGIRIFCVYFHGNAKKLCIIRDNKYE